MRAESGCNTTTACTDIVATSAKGNLPVPAGYEARDRSGKVLTSIPVNADGKAVVEIKTGFGRCERIIADPPKNKEKKYLIDHRFYLALCNKDKAGMEAVLTELTSPKVARTRNFGLAFGLTERLIATHAVIYAKIAWRCGFEVDIDTPWIPKEWLPVKPLAHYDEPWEFMKDFDIFTPFPQEGWGGWSPQRRL